jgi:hypothetical protein
MIDTRKALFLVLCLQRLSARPNIAAGKYFSSITIEQPIGSYDKYQQMQERIKEQGGSQEGINQAETIMQVRDDDLDDEDDIDEAKGGFLLLGVRVTVTYL